MFTYHRRPMRQDGGNGSNNMRTSTLPPFVKQAFLCAVQSFSRDQIEIIQAPYEADFMLAKYASQDNCYVVTNDSDFFIFPSAGCITLRDIEFKDNMEIWLACTTNQMLANRLNLSSVQLLNGLACLSKNDYNTGKGIEEFHAYLDKIYPRVHQMEQIAKFINDNISSDTDLSLKDRLFEVFHKAIMKNDTANQKQLLEVTKQIYDDFDVDKLDAKSKFFDYDWIIEESEKNKDKRADIIESFKSLSIDSDLIDLTTNKAIQLNILIEDPALKGANQLWTQIRRQIFAYHFFHVNSPWNQYTLPDEPRESVSIEEGLIIDGQYVLHENTIDSTLYQQLFHNTTEQNDNLHLFTSIWKLGESKSAEALASVLPKIDRTLWPIVCVYLAMKMEILPQEPRFRVYDWELESMFASFFQIDVNEKSKILELTNLSYEPKQHDGGFRTNDWTSSTFHELMSLMHAGLRMFELCNASINFLIPSDLFRSAILLNNGSLQKVSYERTRYQMGNLWFVDEGHRERYLNIKKLIADVDTTQLPKQDFRNQPPLQQHQQQQRHHHAHHHPRYAPYHHQHHHQHHPHHQQHHGMHHVGPQPPLHYAHPPAHQMQPQYHHLPQHYQPPHHQRMHPQAQHVHRPIHHQPDAPHLHRPIHHPHPQPHRDLPVPPQYLNQSPIPRAQQQVSDSHGSKRSRDESSSHILPSPDAKRRKDANNPDSQHQ